MGTRLMPSLLADAATGVEDRGVGPPSVDGGGEGADFGDA